MLELGLKEVEVSESRLHQIGGGHFLGLDELLLVGFLEEEEDVLDVAG